MLSWSCMGWNKSQFDHDLSWLKHLLLLKLFSQQFDKNNSDNKYMKISLIGI